MQADNVDALESRNTVMNLLSLLRRMTAQLGTLSHTESALKTHRGLGLDPWETLNVYNALLEAEEDWNSPTTEIAIRTLLRWKQSLHVPDSKTAWET